VHFENGKAATPKYTPPIEVLINARGVLEGSKNKQETYKDLLCSVAPLFDERCNYNKEINYQNGLLFSCYSLGLTFYLHVQNLI
jgi:hypothetical protein